jgi:hypothetical protein
MKSIINQYQLVDELQNKVSVGSEHVFIGSSVNAQIKIEGASPFHAMIFQRNNELYILDLKTNQGTFVNGQFTQEAKLSANSIITINNSSLTISLTQSEIDVSDQHEVLSQVTQDISFSQADSDSAEIYYFDKFESLETKKEIISEKSLVKTFILKIELKYKNRLINLNFIELKNGTYSFSDKYKNDFSIVLPMINESQNAFSFQNGSVSYIENKILSHANLEKLKNRNEVSVHVSDFELLFNLIEEQNQYKPLPWWKINTQEKSDFAKKFSLLFIPFFLLMLIDFPELKKEEVIEAVVYQAPPKGSQEDNTQSASGGASAQNTTVTKTSTKSFSTNSLNFFKSHSSTVQVNAKGSTPSVNMVANSQSSGKSPGMATGSSEGLSRGIAGYNSNGSGLGHKRGIDFNFEKTKTVVLGSMDPELLRKILQQYLPQFRHCYQMELAKDENLKGMLDLNFRIESSGKASKIAISSSGKNFTNQGQGCMAKVLEIIPFPKPKGGGVVDVRQPLNFYAENG